MKVVPINIRYKGLPLNVLIEITYRCNFNCSHCYLVKEGVKYKRELNFDDWRYVIKSLKKTGALFLTFTGGEPFLRSDFMSIVEYASKMGYVLRIFTNGSFINSDIAKKLSRLNILEIEMSIYGINNEIQDKITGVGNSLEKIKMATELLVKNNIKVNLKTPVMKENVNQIDEIHSFARMLGAQHFFDLRITPCDDGDVRPLKHRLNFNDVKVAMNKIESITSYKMKRVKGNNYKKESFCNVGRNSFLITPTGDMQPCIQIRKSIGNVLKDDINDVWERSELLSFLRGIKISDIKECSECSSLDRCLVCIGLNYLENKDWFKIDNYTCYINKKGFNFTPR